jgi:rhamnosyltransferase subunit B
VNPFIALGHGLKARGHEVILFAPEPFGDSIGEAGLEFVSSSSVEDFERITANSDLWDPWNGLSVVLRALASRIEENYRTLESLYREGETVLVGHSLSLATRVLEEVKGCPAATVNLVPFAFRSEQDQPALAAGRDFSGSPRWVKRLFWRMADLLFADPPIRSQLNRLRKSLGLKPVDRIFNEWFQSPERIIGLFPNWFGPPQPDWPVRLRLTGFVFGGRIGAKPLDPGLDAFIDEGEPPLVMTPGSANQHAARLIEACVGAANMLGRRLIVLTPFREQLPESMPKEVFHTERAPFFLLFPRCSAVIHHGGIGTCSEALAAGIPQMVVPFGFDQPDNATRLLRLGVGNYLDVDRMSHIRIAELLKELIQSDAVAEACAHYAEKLRSDNAVDAVIEVIEGLCRDREG